MKNHIMQVIFKKTFLKDIDRIPLEIQSKVKQIAFIEIPKIENLGQLQHHKKLLGFKDFHRIRLGDYRIGFKFENNKLTFYRVLHRKEIYKYFP